MLKLTKSFTKRLAQIKNKQDEESGVALISVILVMMLLLMTTVLISLTVMTTQAQTKEFNVQQQARSTADSGMNSFLASVNTSTGHSMLETYKTGSSLGEEQKITPGNALCKTVEETVNVETGYYPKWCAWTVKVSSGTGTSGYYIYSKGFTVPTQDSDARSNPADEIVLRVFIEPIVVDSNTTLDDGKVVYYMPSSAPFQLGITGAGGLTVHEGAKIYSNEFSRNSSPAGTETEFVSLSSDHQISLTPDFVTGTLVAPVTKGVLNICTPVGSSACNDPIHRDSPVSSDMTAVRTAIDAACPNSASSYSNWTASEHGTSTIPPGCYNNVVIDRDMSVGANYTETSPLEINVKGRLTIDSNANVGLNRDPAAFQIRSVGTVTWEDGAGSANLAITKHTNAYIASQSACTSADYSKRTLSMNGALACSTVVIGAKTKVYMDTKSQQHGVDIIDGAPGKSVWFATAVEQL